MTIRRLSWRGAAGRHAALLCTSAFVLAPFIWMLSLSVKSPGEAFRTKFSLLPQQWYAVENYTRAFTASPLSRYLANGVLVCGSILLLQILFCAPAAYALAKLNFKGRDGLFAMVLVALLVPQQVLALPLFILLSRFHILDSYAALILPFIVSPFGIFLFRQFFKSIPDDILYAARLDGVSEFGIVWRIMLPMATPAVIAFSILSIVGHWNDLFWPLIAIRDQGLMPPPLGILAFRDGATGDDYGPLMASAAIIVTPLLTAFLAAQRWFIAGLTAGSVK